MNQLDFEGLIDFMISHNELIDFEMTSDHDLPGSSSASLSSETMHHHPTVIIHNKEKHQEETIQRKSPKRRKNYKRKPSYKIAYIPSLRIVKRDIRRKYIEMLPIIFNTHDITLFSKFLNTFCLPNIISCSFANNSCIGFTKLYLIGYHAIERMHFINSQLIPDTVISFSNNKICQRLHENGSRIIGDFQSVGTMIAFDHHNNSNPLNNDEEKMMEVIENDFTGSQSTSESYDSYDGFVKQFQSISQEIRFSGSYIMILDEQHRFVNICFACSQFHISPLSSSSTSSSSLE